MTALDLVLVAWFALVGPVIDYHLLWPAFRRRSRTDPARARSWLWTWTTVAAWAVVAIVILASSRSVGLGLPAGWRLWASIALIAVVATYQILAIATVARSASARASLRLQIGSLTAVLPHTRIELYQFSGVALTAAFCEEVLYRGFFIAVFAPWLGWWGAAALSLPCFALGHLYQGSAGVLRTGIVGAICTVLVGVSGSLWPAIALHAILDLAAGVLSWLTLREATPP